MTDEVCGLGHCTCTATGYADPGRGGGPLEVYVGRRLRPDQIPLCATHLAEVMRRPGLRRRDLLGLQPVVN